MEETQKNLKASYNLAYHVSRQELHRYSSSLISASDFCTDHPPNHAMSGGSSIAAKIASDFRFDEHCQRNILKLRRYVYKKECFEC